MSEWEYEWEWMNENKWECKECKNGRVVKMRMKSE
jgi:hypothetical protein